MQSTTFFLNCIILLIAIRGISSKQNEHGKPLTAIGSKKNSPSSQSSNPPDMQYENMKVNGLFCTCNVKSMVPERDDYEYTPDIGWHKFHTRAKTWNQARKICIEEGGHLAIINSLTEERILREIFNRSGPLKDAVVDNEAYIGVHSYFSVSDWVTVHGESLEKAGYDVWTNEFGGQPDNMNGVERCGVLLKQGGMNDVRCEMLFPFFCEIPLAQPL